MPTGIFSFSLPMISILLFVTGFANAFECKSKTQMITDKSVSLIECNLIQSLSSGDGLEEKICLEKILNNKNEVYYTLFSLVGITKFYASQSEETQTALNWQMENRFCGHFPCDFKLTQNIRWDKQSHVLLWQLKKVYFERGRLEGDLDIDFSGIYQCKKIY